MDTCIAYESRFSEIRIRLNQVTHYPRILSLRLDMKMLRPYDPQRF